MTNVPTVIAFDVVETLFSLEAIEQRFEQIGLDAAAAQLFFTRLLRDAFALESAGKYVSFRELARASAEVTINSTTADSANGQTDSVIKACGELAPHPDVEAALERAHSAGIRLFALSNGAASTTQQLIESAGFERFLEKILSIDAVHHWKPHRAVYEYAVRESGVDAARVALVAAHAWDTHGAKQAGLTTGWVRRREKSYSSAMPAPDVTGGSLPEVIDKLLNLEA